MPAYRCPACGQHRNARPNWTRSLKCLRCGTLYSTDANRVGKEIRGMSNAAIEQESEIAATPERKIQYVNAYAVSRHYGGPEEGGWYYDAGRPLASVPVRTDGDDEVTEKLIDGIKAMLTAAIGWEKSPRQGRYSVLGGEDFEIYVEDHFAKDWPDRKPHYE